MMLELGKDGSRGEMEVEQIAVIGMVAGEKNEGGGQCVLGGKVYVNQERFRGSSSHEGRLSPWLQDRLVVVKKVRANVGTEMFK